MGFAQNSTSYSACGGKVYSYVNVLIVPSIVRPKNESTIRCNWAMYALHVDYADVPSLNPDSALKETDAANGSTYLTNLSACLGIAIDFRIYFPNDGPSINE